MALHISKPCGIMPLLDPLEFYGDSAREAQGKLPQRLYLSFFTHKKLAPPLTVSRYGTKKFELMLTRRAKVYSSSGSLAENWGVHAKLLYKYQIHYLDRMTIVPWRHFVNDIDLCRSPKSPKKSIQTPILAFKVIQGH